MIFYKNLLINTIRKAPIDSVLRKAWLKFIPLKIRDRVWYYLVMPRMCAPEYIQDLDRIKDELKGYTIPPPEKPIKVLFGPSFSIYAPCFIHDRILSYALRLRGVQIFPIYCDAVQSVECNYFGGVWNSEGFEKNCKNCVNQSQKLWQNNSFPALKLSQYLQSDEIKEITTKVECLDAEQWVTYTEEGFPFGLWAKDILVNNYVVGDYHLIPDYHLLGLSHLRNLLLLKVAYEKIINNIELDRVISNDSCYGMWAILQKLCKKKNIPFYSHWIGGRKGTWCYACNDGAMNLDFSKPWKRFSRISLNERQKSKVQSWLEGRIKGNDMVFNTASLAKHHTDKFDLLRIDPEKPTALLAANLIWDLAALNKQLIFSDMIDWIAETINWFTAHPEFQLIIRPHPAELSPALPATNERVEVGLSKRGIYLPENVFLLSPKVALTAYDLLPFAKVGLVYTTTLGIEMAATGLPVITNAKSPYRGFGFTLDPCCQKEYFELLERTLLNKKILGIESQVDLAYKFILFYHYHYYIKTNIMEHTLGETPKLKIKSAADLLPGKNQFLDYVVESIISGLPIVFEDRWPPES